MKINNFDNFIILYDEKTLDFSILPKDISISTITITLSVNRIFDLEFDIYNKIKYNDNIISVKHNNNIKININYFPKLKFYENINDDKYNILIEYNNKDVNENKKLKSIFNFYKIKINKFYHQITISLNISNINNDFNFINSNYKNNINIEKINNIKIFRNGTIHVAGSKFFNHLFNSIYVFGKIINDCDSNYKMSEKCYNKTNEIINAYNLNVNPKKIFLIYDICIRMINCNFGYIFTIFDEKNKPHIIPTRVNREKLYELLNKLNKNYDIDNINLNSYKYDSIDDLKNNFFNKIIIKYDPDNYSGLRIQLLKPLYDNSQQLYKYNEIENLPLHNISYFHQNSNVSNVECKSSCLGTKKKYKDIKKNYLNISVFDSGNILVNVNSIESILYCYNFIINFIDKHAKEIIIIDNNITPNKKKIKTNVDKLKSISLNKKITK